MATFICLYTSFAHRNINMFHPEELNPELLEDQRKCENISVYMMEADLRSDETTRRR